MSLPWPKNIQLYSKKTAVNSECVTHEFYIKLISWVAVYAVFFMNILAIQVIFQINLKIAIFDNIIVL